VSALFSVEFFYVLTGVFLALVAGGIARDPAHPRRWGSTLFWALLAIVFLFGKALSPLVVGYLVLALALLAAGGQVKPAKENPASREEKRAHADRLGNGVFWPTLLIPATAIAGALFLGRVTFGHWRLLDPKQLTLASLGLGALIALGAGLAVTRASLRVPVAEGSRLLQAMGWALVLPQLLAALGGIFAQAGVGTVIADGVAQVLPTEIPFVAVVAYCVGMALFTIVMGNAFAAFPVITLGIGLPLIVQAHHGNVAVMAAIGMLSGYCGTLLTPMAANFNLVPAMLLELPDRHAVIKAQAPVALVILAANIALMSAFVW
jgi:uncharacterized membrane protein